jgi:hypothetical protein
VILPLPKAAFVLAPEAWIERSTPNDSTPASRAGFFAGQFTPRLVPGKDTDMDGRPAHEPQQEKMDTKERDDEFLEQAKKLQSELASYLDGQQVTRESLDLVISV